MGKTVLLDIGRRQSSWSMGNNNSAERPVSACSGFSTPSRGIRPIGSTLVGRLFFPPGGFSFNSFGCELVSSGKPVGDKIKPDPQVGYSANFPMTAGSAEVAAVGWAAGLKDKDKSDNYPNSLTILGGKIPGGFYNASYTKPTLVQRINGPVPYDLVQMRGNVAGSAQTFYGAVLEARALSSRQDSRSVIAGAHRKRIVGHFRRSIFTRVPFCTCRSKVGWHSLSAANLNAY
jgi:hypothetical protein